MINDQDIPMNNPNQNTTTTHYLPNGDPVPLVLTSDDLINLLRLDDQGPKNAEATLKYYRDRHLLKGIRLGKKIRYTLPEVLEFLEKQTNFTNQRNTG